MRMDGHNDFDFKALFSPERYSTNDDIVSAIIDVRDAVTAEFVIQVGTVADADAVYSVLVEHGDDSGLSDAVAVGDEDLLGTEVLTAFQFDDDDQVRKIGYVGVKSYIRITLSPTTSNSGNLDLSGLAILKKTVRPTDNPPA